MRPTRLCKKVFTWRSDLANLENGQGDEMEASQAITAKVEKENEQRKEFVSVAEK